MKFAEQKPLQYSAIILKESQLRRTPWQCLKADWILFGLW